MMRLAGQLFIIVGIACVAFGLFALDVLSAMTRGIVIGASIGTVISGWIIYLTSGAR